MARDGPFSKELNFCFGLGSVILCAWHEGPLRAESVEHSLIKFGMACSPAARLF
ncbi:hypothetical protein FIV06_07715 [Labrenzia sp. THAF191b]|nr:hypothetical protein FIV06_07715 [Labrenzia sp. THAF191b]QFT03618.1 hypothetical protein FIV05_07715 [Labrenzia sp. THAF191a]QFT15160.1 hypothetical protein FIV03_07720 [Labrenzia sp. THAF187b]